MESPRLPEHIGRSNKLYIRKSLKERILWCNLILSVCQLKIMVGIPPGVIRKRSVVKHAINSYLADECDCYLFYIYSLYCLVESWLILVNIKLPGFLHIV